MKHHASLLLDLAPFPLCLGMMIAPIFQEATFAMTFVCLIVVMLHRAELNFGIDRGYTPND